MSEGYGKDFTLWDALVRERFKDQLEKLGKSAYRNFEVFKSPKGRWMAFHNDSYTDIRVIDLETCEVVAKDFYSKAIFNEDGSYNRERSTYAQHTNVSTFVPIYQIREHVNPKRKFKYSIGMTDLEDNDREWINWDEMICPPIAFNAFTYWAADFELYVDVLDLSKIDEGVIRKYVNPTDFIIPHGAEHVRNYVKFDMDFTIDMQPKEGEPGVFVPTGEDSSSRGEAVINFNILEERSRDRYTFHYEKGVGELSDMYKTDHSYEVETDLPWEQAKKRMDEWRAKQEKKNE